MSDTTQTNDPKTTADQEVQDLKDEISHMDAHEAFDMLYSTVLERQMHPEEGSYTSYLFAKGDSKILKKVGEECTEVIIAALSQSQEELVGELADLMYHLTVLMAQKGVTMDQVKAELTRRHAKKHNLKPERKPVTQY